MKKKKTTSSKLTREERIKKRKEDLKKGSGGGLPYHVIKEGTVRMRMPRIPEDDEFCHEVTFFYLGKDLGGVISPATYGEPCAIFEKFQELKENDNEDDADILQRIKPKRRYLGPFLKYKDIKGKEPEEEIKLTILTGGLYDQLCDFYLEEDKGDFTDPKNGYDVKFKRTGKGQFDTEYSVLDCRPTPIPSKFSKKVYNTEEMIRSIMPTYEETETLLAKFLNMGEVEEEKPQKTKKKKKAKKDI